jgi:hypothetical protein
MSIRNLDSVEIVAEMNRKGIMSGCNWIKEAQDIAQWRALVNPVIRLLVP